MFVAFHQLPPVAMFGVIVLIGLATAWLLIGLVRSLVARSGYWPDDPLPIRESIIGVCGGLFALIVAFSAAGIWSDAATARNAVQREADAVENALVLAASLPAETQSEIRAALKAYLGDVLAVDWPAMAGGAALDDPVFDRSERHLLSAIELLSRQHGSLASSAAYVPLLNQLLDTRHARLARIAASNAGVTWAQWLAMWLISTATLLAIVLCHNHDVRMQIVAAHIYVVVVSAAYFVILAYDRPFVGSISVQPTAMRSLVR